MKALSRLFRVRFASIILAFSVLISSASAQETPTPWQDVITSQVQAFRDHDAAAALSFAGAGFQTRFSSPEEFFVTIMGSGYAPISGFTKRSMCWSRRPSVGECKAYS